uniref:Phosphate-binding protein n=1 Tax=Archaeoglobus fulgidus TaxID=2234 RepID=A0A7C2N734_ARCFL
MRKFVFVALVFSVLLAGCTQTQKPESKIIIAGSGATFPQPQIEKWIDIYTKQKPNVVIEYTGKGSGSGQNDFKQKLVDFACSDPPLKEDLWKELEKMGQPLQFPVVVGAVVVVYNLPGVENLRLDGETLAKIFMGEIEYWDDGAIKQLNPEANLPHERILVVHRSDSSGTTEVFTMYLSLVSKEWAEKVGAGKTVDWPVDKIGRGVGAKGNPGVAAAVKQNPYSIGYVELAFALKENFTMVMLKNRAGKFVTANEETIKSAVSEVSVNIPSPREGYREDLKVLLNAGGDNSYPIVAFSHMIVWERYEDKAKEDAVMDFVRWILTEGQKSENIVNGYVGLPEDVTSKLLAEIGQG